MLSMYMYQCAFVVNLMDRLNCYITRAYFYIPVYSCNEIYDALYIPVRNYLNMDSLAFLDHALIELQS